MTSQILDTLRVTRACEISSIKADLLDLTGTDEAKGGSVFGECVRACRF